MRQRIRGGVLLGIAIVSAVIFLAAQPSVVICHHPSFLENPFGFTVTLIVPPSAVQAHLQHGDTLGPCGSIPTPRPTVTPRATPRATPQPTPTKKPLSTPGPGATFVPPHATPSVTHVPTAPPTDTERGWGG